MIEVNKALGFSRALSPRWQRRKKSSDKKVNRKIEKERIDSHSVSFPGRSIFVSVTLPGYDGIKSSFYPRARVPPSRPTTWRQFDLVNLVRWLSGSDGLHSHPFADFVWSTRPKRTTTDQLNVSRSVTFSKNKWLQKLKEHNAIKSNDLTTRDNHVRGF